jgi:hypothetical protein
MMGLFALESFGGGFGEGLVCDIFRQGADAYGLGDMIA